MKLIDLREAKEKSLVGVKINGKPITDEWNGFFPCGRMGLTSLKGGPRIIRYGSFDCGDNLLASLEGAPAIIDGRPGLHGYLTCTKNNITSLKDIHKICKEINGPFYATEQRTPIKSHILGILYIKGCTNLSIDNKEVEDIVNKHLKKPYGHKRVFECQCALQDAGFDDYAQL